MIPTALLLDLDGTLVDSEAVHRRGYEALFAKRGWDADPSLFTGRRAQDVFTSEPGPWSGLDPTNLVREVKRLTPKDEAPGIAGARDLIIAAVDARCPLAIVTSAGPDWVATSLATSLALPMSTIDVVVTSQDVEAGKPDPECYALACQRLDVDPGTTIAVEDSPAGIRAARGAGVRRVVGITTSSPPQSLLDAGAEATYDDLLAARPHLLG